MPTRRRVLLFSLVLAAGATVASSARPAPVGPLVVWAWQRAEDLRFAGSASIAYLAATARIDGVRLVVDGRRQPLRTRPDAIRIPVLRLEVAAVTSPGELAAHRADLVRVVESVRAGAPRVQIDFDARLSERAFYRDLLGDVRASLPPGTHLSITALASWCVDDGASPRGADQAWIDGLPIDEAVPMLFRMGRDGRAIRAALGRGTDFRPPVCRGAYGLSTDEPGIPLRPGRRVYLFHPRAWTEPDLDAARGLLESP